MNFLGFHQFKSFQIFLDSTILKISTCLKIRHFENFQTFLDFIILGISNCLKTSYFENFQTFLDSNILKVFLSSSIQTCDLTQKQSHRCSFRLHFLSLSPQKLTFMVSRRILISRVKCSFSAYKVSICCCTSRLGCRIRIRSSSSSCRTSIACFWFSLFSNFNWSLIKLYLALSSFLNALSFLSSGDQKVLMLCMELPSFWFVNSSSFFKLPSSRCKSLFTYCKSPK